MIFAESQVIINNQQYKGFKKPLVHHPSLFQRQLLQRPLHFHLHEIEFPEPLFPDKFLLPILLLFRQAISPDGLTYISNKFKCTFILCLRQSKFEK